MIGVFENFFHRQFSFPSTVDFNTVKEAIDQLPLGHAMFCGRLSTDNLKHAFLIVKTMQNSVLIVDPQTFIMGYVDITAFPQSITYLTENVKKLFVLHRHN
jgi:hypothetical protein